MEIKILEMDKMDKVENLEILMHEYKFSINEDKLDKKQFEKLKEAIKYKKIKFYTLNIDNNIIGMCSISYLYSTYKCESIGMFDDFYIKPDYRKKGYAKKLTKYVFEDMVKNNINSVMVGCSDMDLEMYKHIGFKMELGNLLTWDNN